MENTTTYTIIKTGGKQYRVAPGQKITIEKLEQADGSEVRFDALFVKDGAKLQTGKPLVAGASVTGQVVRQVKTKKVLVFKKRAKKGYQKLQGHRQNVTEVLIKTVQAA